MRTWQPGGGANSLTSTKGDMAAVGERDVIDGGRWVRGKDTHRGGGRSLWGKNTENERGRGGKTLCWAACAQT